LRVPKYQKCNNQVQQGASEASPPACNIYYYVLPGVHMTVNKLTASATAVVIAVAPSCAAMVAFLSMLGLMSRRWTKSYKHKKG
jgi:hypothetical protein